MYIHTLHVGEIHVCVCLHVAKGCSVGMICSNLHPLVNNRFIHWTSTYIIIFISHIIQSTQHIFTYIQHLYVCVYFSSSCVAYHKDERKLSRGDCHLWCASVVVVADVFLGGEGGVG